MQLEAKKYLYTHIDDRIVWDTMEAKPPTLRRKVATLLNETCGLSCQDIAQGDRTFVKSLIGR